MFGYPRTVWRTRRSALLLVPIALTVLSAGCTASTTGGPREDPKATRTSAVRPPLTLDGVLATSETLGTLPAGWWADGTSDFRDRHDGLGIALQYKSETAWATFYLYDFGEKDIVGNGEDARIEAVARGAFETLELRDYARVDLRLDERGEPFIIDVNPNPDISPSAGFHLAAERAGLSYPELVERVVHRALSRHGEPA